MTGARTLRDRIRRARLDVKLAWISAALTSLVVLVSFLALGARVRENTRRVFTDQLARNQRTLIELQRRDFQQLLFGASLISAAPTLRAAIGSARQDALSGAASNPILVATVEGAVRDLLRESGKDLLLVTDGTGRVFASAAAGANGVARGTDLSRMPAVRGALDPSTPADSGGLAVLREPDGLYQVAVYPLLLDGFTLGSVLLGQRVDFAYLSVARSDSTGPAFVSSGGEVLMRSPGASLPIDSATLRLLGSATRAPTTVNAGGEEYVAAAIPLGTTQFGQPVRLTLLEPVSATVRALVHPVQVDFAIYGSLAVLLAALGAAFASRSVLHPLASFVEYLRSGAAADAGRSFDAEGAPAEITTLSNSFAELMASLQAKQSQLERRTAELAAANAGLTEEVRARERVETALSESEAQLRQSQKLEAIGTLAGGIAHDFNNLLTVISGFTQFAMTRTEPGTPGADDLRQVVDAAARAATLTRQLLAFSRKQVLTPTILDAGEVVEGVVPMLRRLIGEHIQLHIERGDTLTRILADRGQLEQVIINLVVNARDAMPSGGTITIDLANVHPGGAEPPVVRMRVRDTGTGIPADMLDRIFEPFFTTKEVGKGTGLGLATVYGIVKQTGGSVRVESTVGVGTTFVIDLPAAGEPAAAGADGAAPMVLPRGSETILLVEDEAGVRTLARRTLEELGYLVVAAAAPAEALAASADVDVDLVLTDVVMPGMNGPSLVAQYAATHEAPAVVYMSGYADDALGGFTIDEQTNFLRKPFTPAELARMVRAALDAERRPAGASSA
ncbi:MAG TPA: ATP-binding protein [Gemmatimonadaceae bacterium]